MIDSILNDPNKLDQIINNFLYQFADDTTYMSLNEENPSLGRANILGNIFGTIAIGFFANQVISETFKTFFDLVKGVSKVTSTIFDASKYVTKKVKFGAQKIEAFLVDAVVTNTEGGILRKGYGISGEDAVNFTETLTDSNFDEFANRVVDPTKRQILQDYRTKLKACGLISGLLTASLSPQNTKNLSLQDTLLAVAGLKEVAVSAQTPSCPVPNNIAKLIKQNRGNPLQTVSYKNNNNKIVWLEKPRLDHLKNSTHGQNHIYEINQKFFNNSASESQVIDFVIEQSYNSYTPGTAFSGNINLSGKLLHLEIGDNGFIVTVYPL